MASTATKKRTPKNGQLDAHALTEALREELSPAASPPAKTRARRNGHPAAFADQVDPVTEAERHQGKALEQAFTISAPNFQVLEIPIVGTAPYVQCRFPQKAIDMIRKTQEAGSTGKKGQKREAKDFRVAFEGAMHRGPKGEYGIPASAFRNAMISACKIVGFHMTKGKITVFVDPDFYSEDGLTPMVRLHGEPEMTVMPVRNATGVVDLRSRPMWKSWRATVRVRFDADIFTPTDVLNLMMRVGMQVGVGEGRPDSRDSAGMGWGMFTIDQERR